MYQRILVPFDGSETSVRGVEEAARLAVLTGAKLRLVHVLDELGFATGFETGATYASEVEPAMRRAGEELLEQGRRIAAAVGAQPDMLLLNTQGLRVADAVVNQARDWRADLIVLGTHGRRGVGRLFLGSDAEQIARCAPVPVMLVRMPPSGG
jgi:nucleotide-binding universal stress UspA family protein